MQIVNYKNVWFEAEQQFVRWQAQILTRSSGQDLQRIISFYTDYIPATDLVLLVLYLDDVSL
jgi:hypothetical protein